VPENPSEAAGVSAPTGRVKVSVVTITYNQARYIAEAVDSVLMQAGDFDLEYIVADDASSDGTQAVLQAYQESHPDRIQVVLRDRNVGAQRNLADALSKCTGRYVALLDGDDFWTSRDVPEVMKSQVNYVVADTKRWEQSAAYFLDTHADVAAFVKNAGLGLGIPYLHNGEQHEYIPDFFVKLKSVEERYLLLETKGYDPLKDIKKAAAERWCAAMNAHGGFGKWIYRVIDRPEKVSDVLSTFTRTDT